MAGEVFDLLTRAVLACANWFAQLMTSAGMSGIWLSVLSMVLAIRYLVGPLLFSAGSDQASKNKNKKEKN